MKAHLLVAVLLAPLLVLGCEPPEKVEKPAPADKPAEKPAEKPKVAGTKKALNEQKTLFVETLPGDKRRVLIEASVCLREGPLELLMCKKDTKEHEAIVHADVDAAQVHAALIFCKAEPGSVVKYTKDGRIFPPTGTKIKISFQYEKKAGEVVTVDAKQWVRNMKSHKPLEIDWVFAGSQFFKNPDDPKKPPFYLANGGDMIAISNFTEAMLDLPIASPKDNIDLAFEAWTERIPERGTKVTVILEPVVDEKKN